MGQLYRPKNSKNGFANTGNLKAMLQPASPNAHSATRQADISITRLGMNKPIKIKTEWDPHGNFNNLVKKLIEEMDTLEEAEPPLPGELAETFKYEDLDEGSKADISKNLKLEAGLLQPGSLQQPKMAPFMQYELIQSKLGKFKNTELKIVYFGNVKGNQVAKQLVSVDQNNIFRIHKVRRVRVMADKDYNMQHSDFLEGEDPYKILDWKKATLKQLQQVKVVCDYLFCSLLQSQRLTFLEPQNLQASFSQDKLLTASQTESPQREEEKHKVKVDHVLVYEGQIIASMTVTNEEEDWTKHLIRTYAIPTISSNQLEMERSSVDLNEEYFLYSYKRMTSMDFLKAPRLDWDDRKIEYNLQDLNLLAGDEQQREEENKQIRLPSKLMVAGKYQEVTGKPIGGKPEKEWPFIALVDTKSWGKRRNRQMSDLTMIKCFNYDPSQKFSFFKKSSEPSKASTSSLEITALNYGPYDNGHIVLGFSNGAILILNSFDLSSMFRLQIFPPQLDASSLNPSTSDFSMQTSQE